jgi:hypothetical protein
VVLGVALGASSGLDPRVAGAFEPAAPPPLAPYTPYVDRGNAVPAPYAYGQPGVTATLRAGTPTVLEGSVGFGVGLTSRLWADGSLGTLKMMPTWGFHSLQIGPNALLVDTPAFELDVTTHVSFAADDGRPVEQIEPGIFAVAHAAHALRLDTGLFVDVNPGPATTTGLRVPVALAFQITPHVYAIVNSGVTVGSFADTAGTTAIPLGLTLGWGDRFGGPPRPVGVVVLPSILFPELLKPGAEETLRPGYAAVGLTFAVVSRLW